MVQAFIEMIPGTGLIIGQDLESTILKRLQANAPELIAIEIPKIKARTPVLTGALRDDIEGIPYNTGNDIAFFHTNDVAQLSQWGRVYAPYQEGPPLGLNTYTNPPRQMFYSVLTDDIPDIEVWGKHCVEEAIDLCVQGKGIKTR